MADYGLSSAIANASCCTTVDFAISSGGRPACRGDICTVARLAACQNSIVAYTCCAPRTTYRDVAEWGRCGCCRSGNRFLDTLLTKLTLDADPWKIARVQMHSCRPRTQSKPSSLCVSHSDATSTKAPNSRIVLLRVMHSSEPRMHVSHFRILRVYIQRDLPLRPFGDT